MHCFPLFMVSPSEYMINQWHCVFSLSFIASTFLTGILLYKAVLFMYTYFIFYLYNMGCGYLFILIIIIYMCVHAHTYGHRVHMEVRGQLCDMIFSLYLSMSSEDDLRSSDLRHNIADVFTYLVIWQAHGYLILVKILYCHYSCCC